MVDNQQGWVLRRQGIMDEVTQDPSVYGGRFNVLQHAADDHGTCHFNVVDGHGGAVVRCTAWGMLMLRRPSFQVLGLIIRQNTSTCLPRSLRCLGVWLSNSGPSLCLCLFS